MTNPTTTEWNRPADKIRAGLERDVQNIRDRIELNPAASQARIAAVYLKAKTAMDAMNTANPAKKAADVAAAKRNLFGIDDITTGTTPADRAAMSLSFRDAQQRAAQLTTSAEAQALLDLADQSGDELLARAVGNQALSGLGMDDVATTYLAARPRQAQAAEALRGLTRMGSIADILEFVLPRPPELSQVSDNQLTALAASTLAG